MYSSYVYYVNYVNKFRHSRRARIYARSLFSLSTHNLASTTSPPQPSSHPSIPS